MSEEAPPYIPNRHSFGPALDEIEMIDGTSRRYGQIIFRRSKHPLRNHSDDDVKHELYRDIQDWADRAKKELGE